MTHTSITNHTGLSLAQWHKLPLELRQRWWRETDYGDQPPNEELRQAIKDATRIDWVVKGLRGES
jgi:hypothetical protein